MSAEVQPSTPPKVAISASVSPDIGAFGLSEGHLRDMMADLAVHVLAADMDLAYGGDLRKDGFTELLFELVMRYTATRDWGRRTRVTNHLAWPVHIRTPVEKVECLAADLDGVAELALLGADGKRMTLQTRRGLRTREPSKTEWASGLTAMRRHQLSCTASRVVLGGQVAGYKGRMPGVAEEALFSIRARQPLFLIGGFGGATRDVAEVLGLAEPWTGSRKEWAGRREFEEWTGDDLNNGLSREENEILATTPLPSQVIVLVLRGFNRTRPDRTEGEGAMSHA